MLALFDPSADDERRHDGATLVWLLMRDIHILRNVVIKAVSKGDVISGDFDP